ncbi:hypothetical protein VKS41_009324 [Umbelopsis sp. WA50703]
MKSHILMLLAAAVYSANACYTEMDYVGAGGALKSLYTYGCGRVCRCLKNVHTAEIYPPSNGVGRAFSTDDCTGTYSTITKTLPNAEWVNSVSYGGSGSSVWDGTCPTCVDDGNC